MDHPRLTPAERIVFRYLADGLAVRDIAGRLRVAEPTVRTHARHLQEKFGTTSMPQLVREAVIHHAVHECCTADESVTEL